MIRQNSNTIHLGLSFILILGTFLQSFGQDTIRTYYDDESLHIKEILTKINGKAEGEVRLFDINGNLILIGNLKNDQRNGFFYDLDPETGDTVRVVEFRNNLREGKALSYYPGGALSQESNFVNNQLEGLVTSYFEDGQIRDRTTFKNNKPNGLSEALFPDGKPKTKINFLTGQYHGPYEEFNENGQVVFRTNYAKGIIDGKEMQYFPDGKIKALREFRSGQLNGSYELNYPDGKPERRGIYKNGLPEGEMIEYFQDGSVRMKAIYQKGIPKMPIIYFYPNGSVKQRVTFNSQGDKILEENYFQNEKMISSVRFVNELEEGEVKIFREDGNLQEIRHYSKGRLNGIRELYDEFGKLVETEIWEKGNKINK
ncbi:toxin-antitoxin system YwqK family antitoxin [Algoriphagus sp.]|uniref:toxin-antitoxin system YwqK family antitoxin n=1 Tax=Algoriphagus sp. TaxID=1872435 RepID=UPI00391AA690